MLKLNTAFSKKIPVAGQEFSSQSCHCAVEIELSDNLTPEQLRSEIHRTYDLVRSSVEAELNGSNSGKHSEQVQPVQNNKNGQKATNKQVKFILDLAGQQGLNLNDVNERVSDEFGVATVYDLDRRSASRFVDLLKAA